MKTERNNRIRELREEKPKKSYSKISKIILEEFGEKISRQRVHQIASGYKIPNSSYKLIVLYRNIKTRDKNTCQMCGATDKKLALYHKDFNASNNEPSNLLTICVSCLGYTIRHDERE
jgi:intein-encoded DNA endonuclease-like protein